MSDQQDRQKQQGGLLGGLVGGVDNILSGGEKAQGQGGLLGGLNSTVGKTTEGLGETLNTTTEGLGDTLGETTHGVSNIAGSVTDTTSGTVKNLTGTVDKTVRPTFKPCMPCPEVFEADAYEARRTLHRNMTNVDHLGEECWWPSRARPVRGSRSVCEEEQ
ncbi:hypothetical protein GGR57DRAFT_464728 [Xylariaceae sp. FL1272]|nr:hypothetical protein GGR57DRAFT_464728 [Xylariaceae sp. FL1272]